MTGCVSAEAILDALSTGVLLVDRAGVTRRANARAALLLGREPAGLAHAPLADACPPLAEELRRLTPAGPQRAEVRLGDRVLGYSVSPLPPWGEPQWHLVVFQDITAWAELRDERDRLLRLATVQQTLPSVLHEIRNPLAQAVASLELLVEEAGSGELRRSLDAVLGELRRTTLSLEGVGVVGRSLRSARAHAVDEAVIEVCRILDARAVRIGLHLRVDVARTPLLHLDAAVLRAITYNLVLNSFQACAPGGTVAVHTRLVDGDRTFELTVVDTGAGMSHEALSRCRDLFFSTKRSGSGLGLPLCDRAVTEAGGHLEIETVPGFGTCVRLAVGVDVAE